MRLKLFLVFILVFAMFGLADASFNVSEHYVQKNYKPGQAISGWINISFNNQNLDSLVKDSFGNSINLSDLFDLNENYNITLDENNLSVNSSSQKLYLTNASFYVPIGEIHKLNYMINISDVVVVSENISITDSKKLAESTIKSKKDDLINLSSKINSYPLFLRSSLNSALKIQELEKNLTNVEALYNASTTEQDYVSVLGELEKIKIPNSVSEMESANSVSFVSEKDNIDLEFLKKIGGGDYQISTEDNYKNAIMFWNQENLNPKITFKKMVGNYDSYQDVILTYIELSVNQPSQKVFFIMDNFANLKFDKSYGETKDENFVYIDLSTNKKVIFSTTEDLEFSDLPIFISLPLESVQIGTLPSDIIDSEKESNMSKWILFSLVIIFLIIIFIIIYFVLKSWYDKKYENYLFKNRNNLYNLIVYIHNAKKKGVDNNEIEKNLGKAKWTNEQIRYVMRKYAGERTGLWSPFSVSSKIKEIDHTKFNKP